MLRANSEPQILGHPRLAGKVTLPHNPQNEEPASGSPAEETAEGEHLSPGPLKGNKIQTPNSSYSAAGSSTGPD